MKMFWIVARAGCQISASKRHESHDEAKEECERLAEKEGRTFYVFACIGKCGALVPKVEWEVAV